MVSTIKYYSELIQTYILNQHVYSNITTYNIHVLQGKEFTTHLHSTKQQQCHFRNSGLIQNNLEQSSVKLISWPELCVCTKNAHEYTLVNIHIHIYTRVYMWICMFTSVYSCAFFVHTHNSGQLINFTLDCSRLFWINPELRKWHCCCFVECKWVVNSLPWRTWMLYVVILEYTCWFSIYVCINSL